MKTLTYLKRGILSVLIVVGLSACDSGFQQLNKNPNAPTSASPGLVLPHIEYDAVNNLYDAPMNMWDSGLWVQYYAEIQYPTEGTYNLSGRASMINSLWNSMYSDLENLKKIEAQAQASQEPNVEAIAGILSIWEMEMVTDMWGYVPYSQALQGDAAKQITDPKYDSQQSIYMDLVTKLKSYIAMINPSGSSISQDQIYGGNVTEWQKFGNSLLLRLYMRMQVADPSAAKAGIQSIISSGAPIFTSDADNAYFHYQPDPYENRVYSWFITREDFKVNQTIVDTLKNLNDPRLPVYAVPVRDTSMKSDNPFTYPDSAYVGYPSSVSSGTIPTARSSDIGAYFISPTSPGFLMTYAEVEFIKAEAAARGWISGGPTAAANYYDAGITASMDQFTASNMSSILNSLTNTAVYQNLSLLKNEYPQGITSAQIKTYLQQSSVAYPTSGSLNQQLQAIAKQKWIAMYGQGFEGWSCWRRTQMPVLMPGPNAIFQGANKVPLRMFYPPVEQSLNPTNYKAAVAAQGPDNETTGLLTKIWWEGGK